MSRERWFYEQDNERRGPLPIERLVETLRGLPQPRSCLVWKHGMAAWMAAADVPEIERQLPAAVSPAIAAGLSSEQAALYQASASPGDGTGSFASGDLGSGRFRAMPEERLAPPPVARPPVAERGGPPAVYLAAAAAGVAVVAFAAWSLWFKSSPEKPVTGAPTTAGPSSSSVASPPVTAGTAGAGPAPSATGGEAPPPPGPQASAETAPKGTAFAGWSEMEVPLPGGELAKLRGVAGWSGSKLTITLYNGSTWRVTELTVKTSRLEGEQFVDAPSPALLLPVTEQLDTGVAQILKKVAPDRRKPGVNPLDTGAFEAKVGPQPEAYRWKIEGAKGYPPRS